MNADHRPPSSDEQELMQKLEACASETDAARRRELEDQIYRLVDKHFREAIRGWLAAKFGHGLKDNRHDHSKQYTVLFHDFFVRMLKLRPDPFWKARTASELRKFSSVVMRRLLLDHVRRKPHQPVTMDGFEKFATQRQTHFENRFPGLVWTKALEQWQRWAADGTDTEKLWARLLTQHYVDGMKWREIASDLEKDPTTICKLKTEAIEALRYVLRTTMENIP